MDDDTEPTGLDLTETTGLDVHESETGERDAGDPDEPSQATPAGGIRSSGRVRIIGAEQAGSVVPPEGFSVTDDPLDSDDPFEALEESRDLDLEWTSGRASAGSGTELPHWTDPPTGQVPAVLARDDPDMPLWQREGDTGPVWREHDHDWGDPAYEPSMLADTETRVGEMRTEDSVEDRRPWEFDEPEVGQGDDWRSEDELRTEPDSRVGSTHVGPITTISSSVRKVGGPAPVQARARRGRRKQPFMPIEIALENSPSAGEGSARPTRTPNGLDSQSDGSARSMPLAIATGVAVAALVLLAMWGGPVPTVVLATVVVTLCAAELYGTLRRSGRRSATLLGLVATVGIMIEAYTKGPTAIPFVTVLLLAGTMLWYLIGVERGSPVEGTASTVLVFVWVAILGSFSALLLAPGQFPDRHGVAFFAGAIIAAVLNDVGALVVGRFIGRHPLAPAVSPKKTWEGLIGGSVLAIVGSAFIVGHIHPWTVPKAALLGVVVSVVAPVGDLCESLVKRDLKLKDMGSLLPGHGGMLDRFDAILFVMPATYYLVRLVHLG